MTLNKSKGVAMFRSVGWTWNPLTGCEWGCEYCWAKRHADRYNKPFNPQFREHFLKDKLPDDGTWIFVCSNGDFNSPNMGKEWKASVLRTIKNYQGSCKFLLTSKSPRDFIPLYEELYEIRDRIILGTTIETNREITWSNAPDPVNRAEFLSFFKTNGFKTFLSLEPLADFDLMKLLSYVEIIKPEAIEIGLENYTDVLPRPDNEKIISLVEHLHEKGYNYMMKKNLSWVDDVVG